MADIRLITILPATQTAQGVQQLPGTQGIITQGQSILANLPSGSILSGFIVNRDPQGNPVLRTDKGDVVFSTNFFLKIGSEVVLRVETHAGQTQARLLTVNGQPPAAAEKQSAFTQEPEVIVGQQQPSRPQASTVTQQPTAPQAAAIVRTPAAQPIVTGTLIVATPAKGTEPPLPAGTQITLKVVNITTPQAPAASATTAAPAAPSAPPAPAYSAYARTSGASAPAAPVVTTTASPPAATPAAQATVIQTPSTASPPVTNTTIPIPQTAQPITQQSSMQTPTVSAPAATPVTPQTAVTQAPQALAVIVQPPRPGEVMTATVLAPQPSGETVVQTPAGMMRLAPGVVLPQHSQVTFEVMHIVQAPAGATAAPPAPPTELARQWPAMQQIVTLLINRGDADPMKSSLAVPTANLPTLLQPTATPQAMTPQSMPVGLMLFMAALKSGDFRNWLGQDNVQWLEQSGHAALVKKAEGDFMTIARQFSDAAPSQWQALFFPVGLGGEVQQARLFVKRDGKKQARVANAKGGDTRFVLEVDLSQLGEMQMDGFVRRRNKEMEFDLVIRSLNELDAAVQRDIIEIYNKTGELTGYKGQLIFQAVREFPVHPMEEMIAEHINSVLA